MSVRLRVLCVCAVACGCVSTTQQWTENGQPKGTIKKVKMAEGVQWQYTDGSGLLRKTEMRYASGSILPGASVTERDYDQARRLVEERFLTSQGLAAKCPQGFACKKLTYLTDDRQNAVEELALFDEKGGAVCSADGYARARSVRQGKDGFVKEVFLSDAQNRPASATWDKVPNVARVAYVVLEGIGDVRCGIYYGAEGQIVDRKQVSGTCVAVSQNNSAAYGNHPGMPPPRPPPPMRMR